MLAVSDHATSVRGVACRCMLTPENDIDIHALRRQGWTISAIARHLGRDRKTIRAISAPAEEAGVRVRCRPGSVRAVRRLLRAAPGDDPHLWGSTLFDELLELGYGQSYPTMTRQIRARNLRPACEPCHPATGRAVAVIEHPAGQETQWDWVELPDPPPGWGWGATAHLLVGALSHSGKSRGCYVESEDQPHLIDALDRVAHALGGLTLDWRFDRMATVISPNTGGSARRSRRWPSTTRSRSSRARPGGPEPIISDPSSVPTFRSRWH